MRYSPAVRQALRPCSADPRCPNLTTGGPCPTCARKRPSAAARGYDRAWSQYSRAWLRVHRYCGERADGKLHRDDSACARAGLKILADVTDHIVASSRGGAHMSPGNSQSLCYSCNRRKARMSEIL